MIFHNEYISEEAAEYLNSHPAFKVSDGYIMNKDFFDKYIHLELLSDNPVPVLDRYRESVCGRERFDLDDAKAFLIWLDPKWTEYMRLDKSEFFKEKDLKFANDGIEFMDI